ncbi:MAG: hypothetical protein AABY98_08710 [Candidatus Deferrimicrobiota bacterium]
MLVSVRNGLPPAAAISSTTLRTKIGRMKAVFPFSPKWSLTAVRAPRPVRSRIPAARRSAPVLSIRLFPGRAERSVNQTVDCIDYASR